MFPLALMTTYPAEVRGTVRDAVTYQLASLLADRRARRCIDRADNRRDFTAGQPRDSHQQLDGHAGDIEPRVMLWRDKRGFCK